MEIIKQFVDYSRLKYCFSGLSFEEQCEKIALVTLMGRPKLADELRDITGMNKLVMDRIVDGYIDNPSFNMKVDLQYYFDDTETK